jgi:hypothetical protein
MRVRTREGKLPGKARYSRSAACAVIDACPPVSTAKVLSSRSPPAIPPEVFSVTTSIQPGTSARGNRALRHPAWRSPSSTVALSRRRTVTASSPTARCNVWGSGRQAASYIGCVELLLPPGQRDVATVHHRESSAPVPGEVAILFDEQDGHVGARPQQCDRLRVTRCADRNPGQSGGAIGVAGLLCHGRRAAIPREERTRMRIAAPAPPEPATGLVPVGRLTRGSLRCSQWQ